MDMIDSMHTNEPRGDDGEPEPSWPSLAMGFTPAFSHSDIGGGVWVYGQGFKFFLNAEGVKTLRKALKQAVKSSVEE